MSVWNGISVVALGPGVSLSECSVLVLFVAHLLHVPALKNGARLAGLELRNLDLAVPVLDALLHLLNSHQDPGRR